MSGRLHLPGRSSHDIDHYEQHDYDEHDLYDYDEHDDNHPTAARVR